jgi:hypothetical protein
MEVNETQTQDTASDMSALDSLLAGMDDNGAAQTQEDTSTSTEDTTTTAAETQQTQVQEDQSQTKNKPTQAERMNYAFGQMRTELNANKALLAKLATAAGIQYTDENDLIAKLNDNALNQLAQRQNVPVDLLKRMETLEQNNAAYEMEQRKTETMLSFQKLQTTYGLTNEELLAFAQELDEKGMNPFASRINIDATYRDLHFDEIVNKRVAAAVEEALKKSSVADTHSSTPNRSTGKGDNNGDGKKITTVSQLSALLDGVK